MSPYQIWKSGTVWHVWRQMCQMVGVFLMHLVEFLNHLTFNPVPDIANHVPMVPYLDHLIKMSSPHDSDLDFSKIRMPYSPIASVVLPAEVTLNACSSMHKIQQLWTMHG